MGKRKPYKQAQTFNKQAQDSQIEYQVALFKKKFPFMKERAEECMIELKSLKHPEKIPNTQPGNSAEFYSSSFAMQNDYAKVPGKEYFESQIWSFQNTAAIDQYFRLEDAIQTTLMENEYTKGIVFQINGNYVLDTLALFSSMPFLKGLVKVTLYYYEPAGLTDFTEKDCEFKTAFQTSMKLSAKMIFSRQSLQQFTISTTGSLSSESIALGIIEGVAESANSLRLETFSASTFIQFLSKPSACLLLESLASIKSLKTVDLGAFNLLADSSNDIILALNKVLSRVEAANINIGDLKPNGHLPFLRFAKYYTSLQITYSCDELRNPEVYEELFRCLSDISFVDSLCLSNSFNLNCLEPTRATKSYKNIKDIRQILRGSALVEKQFYEEENTSGKDSITATAPTMFPAVQSFKFFELLLSVKQTKLTFLSLMSKRIIDSLMNLFRTGNVTQIDLLQRQPYVISPPYVPLQIKRVYENEAANIDFDDLYQIFKTNIKNTFTASYTCGSLSIIDGDTVYLLLSTLQQRNSTNIPVKFNPLAFSFPGLQNLTVTLGNVTQLSQLEQIFQQASECPALKFLQVDTKFDQILRNRALHNKLHEEIQNTSGEHSSARYLLHLVSLQNLRNVILNIDLDQYIIDSITELILQNKSIKTLIFRRKSLSQYTLDFSALIGALRKSSSITHALLDLRLEHVYINVEDHRAIFNKHVLETYSIPLANLLEDPECKLNTLEILQNIDLKGFDLIAESLLKKRNKTVLNLDSNVTCYLNQSPESLYGQAVSQNLMRIVDDQRNDSEKFISVF